MTFFQAIILGIVEGLMEFLPVSSTGHLILSAKLLDIAQSEFLKTFQIAIQLGAILSVVALYWRSFFDPAVLKRLVAAFIPTALIGAVLYKLVKTVFLGSEDLVLWSLFIGGGLLILFEYIHHEKEDGVGQVARMSYRQAVLIGLAQSVAMIPGVSRSAATILGGLLLGIKRRAIVEFSFLLAVPTMAAATALDLYKSADSFSGAQWDLLAVGFVVSFVVAIGAIKFFLNFIKTRSFIPFGIYRIFLALVFWFAI